MPSICGTVRSPAELAAMEGDFVQKKFQVDNFRGSLTAVKDIRFGQVHFHNVYMNKAKAGGYVEDTVFQNQIHVMNDKSKALNIHWTLAGIDHEQNSGWFYSANKDTPQDAEMKKKLHVGDASALNVYTVRLSGPAPGLLGYTTFPWEYNNNPEGDGIVINYATLPGGTLREFNLGHTLVHETGHWLGLFHTFEGTDAEGNPNGCIPPGDHVEDTPYQRDAAEDCKPRNSCPEHPGMDPIHNFMNYAYDSCLEEFTFGQAERVREQIGRYRGL
ncbi:hypothetical protein DXG01_000972 [Tephrocybe rancida]|nr:hypothetical protein DXG01_000972 [Tephrocybe rancida]